MPVRYTLSIVWARLSMFSVIHYTICAAVCFQFTYFLCDDWENTYTLSNYHNQIGKWTIYYPLFRVRSWNNGMRCMSFYILMFVFHENVWLVSKKKLVTDVALSTTHLCPWTNVMSWDCHVISSCHLKLYRWHLMVLSCLAVKQDFLNLNHMWHPKIIMMSIVYDFDSLSDFPNIWLIWRF